ncbi:family 10 glycosylhydrolase [Leptothermofonsia sichuanensis E412]|uniref:family 10 glycosylhydrolase n=1 Tax=Leptothermofonsia sichuanensis TaxID=2917832 RepID=UPI001CA6A021|nr:family 10 glycosylhydrolase [Leptothermofonsia sichuanensis]QZZ19707.1 family 10 glycosylhydrolase [Leptothermofonsia sichuanensis E412]
MPILTVTQNTVFKKTTAAATNLSSSEKFPVSAGQFFTVNYAFRVGEHCFIELPQPLGMVGRVGYFYLLHVKVSLQELRGVWLTNIDSEILYSRQNLKQGFQLLKTLGFNTIYPVVWHSGYTLYPSPIAQTFCGSATIPHSHFTHRDLLAEILEEAKPLNLRVIPCFEYGLMTAPNSSLALQRPDLLTTDRQNNQIFNRKLWLNPCQPEVQQFLAALMADVAERYEVDGIQLDDNFGFPAVLGYDSFSQALYRRENQGKPMPQTPEDPQRQQWCCSKLTTLLQQIVSRVKAKRNSLISLSPNPWGFARKHYHADWRLWQQMGLVEELVVQVYRSDFTTFVTELDKAEVVTARSQIPTAIAILTGLNTKPVSFSQFNQQIQKTREKQFAGIVCFFYETLLYQHLSPTKIPRNLSDLQRLFPSIQEFPFSDLDRHWASACMLALTERGVMRGYPDRTCRPDVGMTRAEFAALVAAVFPSARAIRPPGTFSDVSPQDWFHPAIQWATERGLLAGYPDGTFRPHQMASKLQAILVLVSPQSVSNPWVPHELLRLYFEDLAQVSDWAKKALSDAIVADIVVNYPNVRQLRPNQIITRGEVAALVCRTLKILHTVPRPYATWYWGLDEITEAVTVPYETWNGSGRLMRDIQVRLSQLGLYPVHEINGAYNWKTEQGLIQFCTALNLPNMKTGVLDQPFARALINTSSLKTGS